MGRNSKIPFSSDNLVDALKELVSAIIFAFLPINLGLLFSWLSSGTDVDTFVFEFFSSGEALLVSSALVGPLIYVLLKQYGDFSSLSKMLLSKSGFNGSLSIQFPGGWYFIVSIVVICVVAAGVFGNNSASSIDHKILAENMIILSTTILILSLLIFFLVSLIRNNVEDGAVEAYIESTDDFLEEWDEQ